MDRLYYECEMHGRVLSPNDVYTRVGSDGITRQYCRGCEQPVVLRYKYTPREPIGKGWRARGPQNPAWKGYRG